MISKNKFRYETHQDALDALNKSLNWDFELELGEINLWIREFLRDTPNDNEWLNIVINNIGCNCSAIKHWFITESEFPESWSETNFETITMFSDFYKTIEV
jgi:hypothetical protein